MTMYERIKCMTEDEMKQFIYWVYMNGNKDGELGYCDSEAGYFGSNGYILNQLVHNVMPHNTIDDLWDNFNELYNKK